MAGRSGDPAAFVRERFRFAVAPLAEILLVTRHAARPVPGSLCTVRNSSPGSIVVKWLGIAMTCNTDGFLMAGHALRIAKF